MMPQQTPARPRAKRELVEGRSQHSVSLARTLERPGRIRYLSKRPRPRGWHPEVSRISFRAGESSDLKRLGLNGSPNGRVHNLI